jgi:glycine cleavage system H protein
MSTVRACDIPDDLYYQVENNIWVKPESDTEVIIGMTAYASSLAGQIIAFTPKKVGRSIKQNKSCATVESGKWVGPIKVPMNCELYAINEAALDSPQLINSDPYGEGWLCKLKIDNWSDVSAQLLTGADAIAAFDVKMEEDGFGGC